MTQKLDNYRPNVETLMGVKRQLHLSGVDPGTIPESWVEATIAAMAKWIHTTEAGAAAITHLLGFESTPGTPDKAYTLFPDTGPHEVPVKPENIMFFRGAMVNNLPTSLDRINIRDKGQDSCEDCGIMGHCIKSILDPGSQALLELCNSCVTGNEHPKIYDHGDTELCGRCPQVACSNHPVRQQTAHRRIHG